MASRDWIVGSMSALVGVAFGIAAGRGMAKAPPAGPRAPAPVSVPDLTAREAALDRREAALAERERALATGVLSAVPAVVPASTPAPVAVADAAAEKPLSEEERVRKEVLEAAEKLGGLFAKFSEETEGPEDGVPGVEEMQAATDLMALMTLLKKHEKALVGDLGADVSLAMFDGMMPEGLGATDDQKARFREFHRDMENRLRMAGIPLEKAGLTRMGPDGLSEEQQREVQAAQGEMLQRGMALLSPPQAERFQRLGGGQGTFRIAVGEPEPSEGD